MIGSVFVKQMLIFSQMGNCGVDSDAEKEQIVRGLEEDGLSREKDDYEIKRSKGLGENQPDMMSLTTMHPATRRLIKIDPAFAQETADKFDLLLGDNLNGRKEHIAENGHLYIDMADVS